MNTKLKPRPVATGSRLLGNFQAGKLKSPKYTPAAPRPQAVARRLVGELATAINVRMRSSDRAAPVTTAPSSSATMMSSGKIAQPPQAASRSRVYLDTHVDDGGRLFFSVNFFDGEGGLQSQPIARRADARTMGRRLAAELGVRFARRP
jgi:hypothetical protein